MKHSMQHIFRSTTAIALGLLTAGAALAQQVPNTARPELIERQNRIETPRPEVGGAPHRQRARADSPHSNRRTKLRVERHHR